MYFNTKNQGKLGIVTYLILGALCDLLCGYRAEIVHNKRNHQFSYDLESYKNRVKDMFYHAYNNYINHAYPYDELKPISCSGFDTWGSYSLTLIDSLDMLIILGNKTEFERVANLLENTLNVDKDINVSVFETNIRVIGGLLSAHLLSYRLYLNEDSNYLNVSENLDSEWPCNGPLLRLAVKFANKLLPAFDTPTGMPFGTVNLKNGVPKGETTETCVAGVGTFLIEFATLSRLTGDPVYENAALKAMNFIWKLRSPINLIGNHIRVDTGRWSGLDATIGSGVDSYFEYLVKGGILLNRLDLIDQFRTYQRAINKHLYVENWFFWANMNKGQKSLPLFSSLEAFYPGVLTLVGDLDQAVKLTHSYHQIWRQYGSLPEFFNIQSNTIHSNREAYPLRPELIESVMYILRATNYDQTFLEMAVDYLESIDRISKINCGFATVKDVKNHKLEDRMESFFLAETLKYLYLIFDKDNFLHNDISSNSHKLIENKNGKCMIETGFFLFNTEAHPVDGASLECCRSLRAKSAQEFDTDEDLLQFLNLEKLVDRYVRLKNPTTKSFKHSIDEDFYQFDSHKENKTLREEYEELKVKIRQELDAHESNVKAYCDELNNQNETSQTTIDKTKITRAENKQEIISLGHNYPFTCSLNNTFRLSNTFLNSINYFP